jgi:MipA family protein
MVVSHWKYHVRLASRGIAWTVLTAMLCATSLVRVEAADLAGDLAEEPIVAPEVQPAWVVALGGGVGFGTDYEGSDDYSVSPIPAWQVSYRNTLFVEGLGLRFNAVPLFSTEQSPFSAGAIVQGGRGREENDNIALKNLGDIDGGVDVGGFVSADFGVMSLNARVLKNVGDGHDGTVADLAVNYNHGFSDKLFGSVGLSTSWADDTYMSKFFGITDSQAVKSGYRKYNAESGFKSVGVDLGLLYNFTDHVSAGASVGYSRLLDNAADSPLVKEQGSADQFNGGLILNYRF